MIKYNLKCQNDHEFESWFSNSQEFDKLLRKNLLDVFIVHLKKLKINYIPNDFKLKNKR